MLADSKSRPGLNKNSKSFEKGDNITKISKVLEENIETTTRVGDELSVRFIKNKLKAKNKCIVDIVQATSNYVDTLFETVINSINTTSTY